MPASIGPFPAPGTLLQTAPQTLPQDSVVGEAGRAAGVVQLLQAHPTVELAVWLIGIVLVAWLSNLLTKRYLLGAIGRIVAQTRFTWDDAILRRRVFRRLANIAPLVVIHYGIPLVPGIPAGMAEAVQRVCLAFLVIVVLLALDGFMSALNDIYSLRPDAKSRPIKGYVQILKIVLYIVAGILVVSFLTGERPTLLLGGLGAMTAVLLLIFRDTILSLVASIQITQYDMVAVGDWIEMPKYGADGDVIDIALHTIKVQNWDKTITTIPTHKFIEDSFKNWRGMSRSGGRRIKRSFSVDMNTIRFLDGEDIARLRKYELLSDYFAEKLSEIDRYNEERTRRVPDLVPNARRLTNIGTLRAYIVRYLREHPVTHKDMTLMVRQLKPGPDGLPLELYFFSSDTNWVSYEGIQADIFDHIFAIIPEFGLRVFQAPSGRDLEALAPSPRSASMLAALVPLIPLALSLGACERGTATGPTFSTRDSAGVVIAENGGELPPSEGAWSIGPEPSLQIGTLQGDDAYMFQRIWGATRLSDGSIAMADNRAAEIRIFGPGGEHLHTFGRRGEGPGEFNSPVLMGAIPGDTLVVVDRLHRRVNLFHPDVGYIRSATAGPEIQGYLLTVGMFASGTSVLYTSRWTEEVPNGLFRFPVEYRSVALDGSLEHDFGEFLGDETLYATQSQGEGALVLSAQLPFGKHPSTAVSRDRFYYSSQDRYEIQVRREDGALLRVIRRDKAPRPVTDAQVADLMEELTDDAEDTNQEREFRRMMREAPIPDLHPALGSIYADTRGYLWVEEARVPGEEERRTTIFDPEGRMVGSVTLPARLQVQEIGADYVLGRWVDDLGVNYLRMYPLVRPPRS